MKILLCALEPSADALGAALMASLQEKAPGVAFVGCGGPQMAAQGLNSLFPIDRFSVIGPVAALGALPAAKAAASRLARLAETQQPAAAVFVDSWSFSRLAAIRMKQKAPGTRMFKYVAPQIWASRPNRAAETAQLFEGVLCLFEFEPPMFEAAGVKARWVGHAGFQRALHHPDQASSFRARHGLADAPLLSVLLGSRRGELRRHGEPFGETVRLARHIVPDLRVVAPAAPGLSKDVGSIVQEWPGQPVVIEGAERFDAFQAADAALAASGTAIAELAIFNTPTVVAYRTDSLTALWARQVITTPYVSLVNIAAGHAVLPEFLQERCRAELMAPALAPLLKDSPARREQLQAFPGVVRELTGARPPGLAAADALLDWLDRGKAAQAIESAANGA